ncbi:MAG: phage DNA ejection protein [Plesiomonas shigelloides]
MLGVPQPMNYGQPENIGMQLGQGLGALSQSLGAAKQQETELAKAARLKEFQGAFGQAYAQQDRDAMRQLVAKYPEQFDAVRQGMSVINDENRAMMGEASADLRLAASTGNPEAVKAAAARYAPMLEKFGTTPELIAESFSQSPDEFAFQADMFGLHALGPEKYFDVMDQRAQRDIQREGMDVQRRGQDITLRGQNISAQNAALDREIKRAELQEKAIDRQLSRETNELKIEELKIKQQEARDKIEKAKAEKEDTYFGAVDTMDRTIETANKVLNSEGFSGYFGTNINPLSSRFIPGTAAADTSALIDTLKSQGFMSGIQQMKGMGALSNAEGQKVVDAIGSLSANQSEKSAKEAIKTIIDTTEQAKKRMAKKSGKEYTPWAAPEKATPQQQPQATPRDQVGNQGGYSSLWGG